MNNQISLDESMPDASAEQRVGVLLVKLGIRYGKKLELCDLYPQYKSILHVPTPIVKKIAEELHRELVAADMLGELAKNAYTLGEKLNHYKTVIDKLHEQTSAKELAKPVLWENAKRLISSSIAEGKGAQHKLNGDAVTLTETDALFLLFKEAYPKKASMGKAEKWFKTHKPSADMVNEMLSTIEIFKCCEVWRKDSGKYVPYPYTWLNAKGWEDALPLEETSISPVDLSAIKIPVHNFEKEAKSNE